VGKGFGKRFEKLFECEKDFPAVFHSDVKGLRARSPREHI
jgi:hypothetical protein